MSLLLEALKKAELAKQRAGSAEPAQEAEPASERPTPVITREKLPDIGQHLEILSDDLPSARSMPAEARTASAPTPMELAIAPDPAPRSAAPQSKRPAAENQEAARRLFEVREIDYNPRRPFYLTLVALGVVGVAYGGYVWWQLQPKYSYTETATHATTQTPSSATAALAAVAAPVTTTPAHAPQSASTPAALPQFRPAPAAVPAAPLTPSVPPRRLAAVPHTTTAPLAPRIASAPVAAVAPPNDATGDWRQSIAVNPSSMQVDPQLERAYEAVQKNDLDAAREIYQGVLQRDSNNRDALLGMAAIDVRTRNYEIAEARYLRLLELNPRDGYAQAGLLALRQSDPVASESRLKNLLATQPESPQLYFALGNQYALQSRWGEAQQAYFRALAADPENPDYAFNLAVSLDHLHQKVQAVEFYRRSLVLADRRPGTFDRALAAARARELQQR
jgi:tetratricopeptide (TPR) repeat protein